MKRFLSIFITIASVLFAGYEFVAFGAEPAEKTPRSLKVMSYNIFQGRMASMQRLADEIKAQNPDFVALQEVDINTWREYAKEANGINFINELAQRTGMFGYFGRTIDCCGGWYGIAILSKHPAVSVESVDLPNPKNAEPRIMLKGRFMLDGHTPFVFASTHFDYSDSTTIAMQAETIVPVLEKEGIPAIVAGDFNCQIGSVPVKYLSEKGKLLSGGAPTWPSDAPRMRIDHIFGFPKEAFTLESTTEGLASKYAASDHLPVVSEITVEL